MGVDGLIICIFIRHQLFYSSQVSLKNPACLNFFFFFWCSYLWWTAVPFQQTPLLRRLRISPWSSLSVETATVLLPHTRHPWGIFFAAELNRINILFDGANLQRNSILMKHEESLLLVIRRSFVLQPFWRQIVGIVSVDITDQGSVPLRLKRVQILLLGLSLEKLNSVSLVEWRLSTGIFCQYGRFEKRLWPDYCCPRSFNYWYKWSDLFALCLNGTQPNQFYYYHTYRLFPDNYH